MMTKERTETRAWVGCLACYNEGRLVGSWVDGLEAADEQPHGDPDEWAGYGHGETWVFDHEGYGGLLDGECSPAEAQAAAEAIDAAGEDADAFGAWVAGRGVGPGETLADLAEMFEDVYLGNYDELASYAWELVESTGMLDGVDATVQRYFDLQAFARDLELGGDVVTAQDGTGGVYVFDGHA